MAAKKPQKALFRRKIAQNSACGGAGGIRTHGRVLAVKRFRVVLVMTTSIPLRVLTLIFVPRFLERHSGENRFSPLLRRTPEALILLHFLTVSFLLKRLISSQGRYNHFDTAPYINFDFLPSIFGETFGREVLLSAPSINPGSIDFTGFFACKLLHEGDDFEFHANKPNSKWVTGISYIHTKQGVLYLSISTTTASLPTRPEHSRR